MIINSSEKIINWGFPKELHDIFKSALDVIMREKGLYFSLTLSTNDKVNAFAGPCGIEICQGLIERLHCEILKNGTFNIATFGIKERYSIANDIFDINSMVLDLTILICFFHEFGHIVSGHIDYDVNKPQQLFSEAPQSVKGVTEYAEGSILEYDADAYAGKTIAGVVQNNLLFECPENVRSLVEEQFIQLASFALFYIFNSMGSDENIFDYPPYIWRMYTVSRMAREGLRQLREHGNFLDEDSNVPLDDMDTKDFRCLKNDISKIIKGNDHNGIDIFSNKKMQQWLDFYNEHSGMLVNVHKCIANPSDSIFYKKNS